MVAVVTDRYTTCSIGGCSLGGVGEGLGSLGGNPNQHESVKGQRVDACPAIMTIL